jgi:protoporphyrinogen oxidase
VTWEASGTGSERVDDVSAVVIALSAHDMLRVYPGLDPVRSDIVSRLEYGSSVHVYLGLDRVPAEPCYGIMVPRREHPGLLATGLEHHKPGRAPVGKALIAGYFRSAWNESHWDLDDETILRDAVGAINGTLPGLADNIEMTHVQRVQPCLLRGKPGIYGELANFAAATDSQARIQFAGDYFPVSSTNSCLRSGEIAAERIARRVGASTTIESPLQAHR